MTIRRLALLPLAAALFLAGCAGPSKDKTADNGEYEWVTPLGSNVPVKVRKGQAASTSSPTANLSGEQAASIFNSAGGKVPTDKGGK